MYSKAMYVPAELNKIAQQRPITRQAQFNANRAVCMARKYLITIEVHCNRVE